MGESCIVLLIELVPMGNQVIALVGQCATNPDPDLVVLSLYFWYRLSEEINALSRNSQDHANRVRAFYGPELLRVVDHLRGSMKFPDNFLALSSEQQEEYKKFRYGSITYSVGSKVEVPSGVCYHYRYSLADAVLDVSSLLDTTALLQHSYVSFQEAAALYRQNNELWPQLEACLYCIRSIARNINLGEQGTAAILPQVSRLCQYSQIVSCPWLILITVDNDRNRSSSTSPIDSVHGHDDCGPILRLGRFESTISRATPAFCCGGASGGRSMQQCCHGLQVFVHSM